jgi:hypothetical protein
MLMSDVAWPTCQWMPVAATLGGTRVTSMTKLRTERKKFFAAEIRKVLKKEGTQHPHSGYSTS